MKPNNRSRLRSHLRSRQRGYLLMELGLVLIISSLLAASQFSKISQAVEETLAIATGQYMVEQQSGVNLYVLTNIASLSISGPVPGFASPLEPTVAELKAANYLPAGFDTVSPMGLSFRNVLTPTNCPGANCLVSGLAHSTTGYTDQQGDQRTDLLGTVIGKVGIDGGLTFPDAPAVVQFFGGGSVANPAGSVAGTLVIRIGSGSGITGLLNQFYKLDGTRPLAGALNAANNDIQNVKDLDVDGKATLSNLVVSGDTTLTSAAAAGSACTAAEEGAIRKNSSGTGLVICSGNQFQVIGNAVAGITNGGTCSVAGQLGTSATGVSYFCNGNFWSLSQNNATAGDVCAPAGRTATSLATSEQLICKNGRYLRMTNLIAKTVEISRTLIVDGQSVAKPTCDFGGTASYSFHLTQTVVDVAVVPPRQAMYITATDTGSAWSVIIRVRDNAGGEFSANTYAISAVMKLECTY